MERKTTQNMAILAYLQKGKSINPMKALKKFGCFRLSARIHDLREMGYNIETRRITKRDKSFAEYKLIK